MILLKRVKALIFLNTTLVIEHAIFLIQIFDVLGAKIEALIKVIDYI